MELIKNLLELKKQFGGTLLFRHLYIQNKNDYTLKRISSTRHNEAIARL